MVVLALVHRGIVEGVAGIEPASSGFGDRCSACLNSTPIQDGAPGRTRTCIISAFVARRLIQFTPQALNLWSARRDLNSRHLAPKPGPRKRVHVCGVENEGLQPG